MTPRRIVWAAWAEVRLYSRAVVSPLLARRDRRRASRAEVESILEAEAAKAWRKRGPNGGAR